MDYDGEWKCFFVVFAANVVHPAERLNIFNEKDIYAAQFAAIHITTVQW